MVEVCGQEVPEEFWPEESVYRGQQLVGSCSENDEASPVVLDQFAHAFVRDLNSSRALDVFRCTAIPSSS